MDNRGFEQPVTEQPGRPSPIESKVFPDECPPGLEPLQRLNQLIVREKTLYDKNGLEIFRASFHTPSGCCGSCDNGLDVSVYSTQGKVVMTIEKEASGSGMCCYACCWCTSATSPCVFSANVKDSNGQLICTFKQEPSACKYVISCQLAEGNQLGRTANPCCQCLCCDQEMQTIGPDGEEQGVTAMLTTDKKRQLFPGHRISTATFSRDLDVRSKAAFACGLLIGAYYTEMRVRGAYAGAMAGGMYAASGGGYAY